MRILLSLAAVMLLAACPGDEGKDYAQSAPSQSPTTSPPTQPGDAIGALSPVPPQTERPTTRPATGGTEPVDVHLIEYAIHMPSSVAAGTQTFNVVNGGKENHNLEIEGDGVEKKLPSDLTRGGNATLTVDLKPGTYTVYCPVKDHRQKGMEMKLTVP